MNLHQKIRLDLKRFSSGKRYEFDISNNNIELKLDKYWDFPIREHITNNPQRAIEEFDNDLKETFRIIKNQNPSKKILFGNSGGFDSRLIPVYANAENIPLSGYTICEKKPNYLFKSVTYKNSEKIARLLDFESEIIEPISANIEEQLERDIYTNPFGPCQLYKSYYHQNIDNDNILITGQQDQMIKNTHFGKVSDLKEGKFINQIINYFDKGSLFKSNRYIWMKYLKVKNARASSRFIKFLSSIEDDFEAKLRIYYSENKEKEKSLILTKLYQTILDKNGFNGGFESQNRYFKTYYLYYPLVFENSYYWSDELLNKGNLLMKIILYRNMELAKIPSQELKYIINKPPFIYRKLSMILRENGLEYNRWHRINKHFSKYKSIMGIKNPLFEKIAKHEDIYANRLHNSFKIFMDFVKIKKILDIIYYNEIDTLLKRNFNYE